MKKIILLLTIFTTSFIAYSQNKIALTITDPVDGDKSLDIVLTNTETVNINSLGDITATTVWDGIGGFEEALVLANISVGGTSPGLDFSCTNSVDCMTINAAETTVTVTVNPGATYCNEFAGTSSIPFKTTTNSVDPYITQLTRVIDSSTSSIYSVECGNNGGSSTKQTINVSLATAPTVSISPGSQSVTSGNNQINVTWAASANALECIFNGDWPAGTTLGSYVLLSSGTGIPSSSFSFTNIVATKTLTVSCKNAIGTSVQAEEIYSITGVSTDSWTTCIDGSPANPILNGNEDRSILSGGASFGGPPNNPSTYNGLFEDLQGNGSIIPFPGVNGDIIQATLEPGKYIAAKFTTNSLDYESSIKFTAPTTQEGPNSFGTTVTISTCPGDFTNNLNQVRCISTSSLRFSTKDTPGGPPGYFCELEKNTTYFLNIVDSDNSENDNYETSDCLSSFGYCGSLITRSDITF